MLDDLRIGARAFLRQPGFAVLAIVTLAVGIAANTAMFSVVNGVLLQPLPFTDPDRVVVLQTSSPTREDSSHSATDFREIVREQQSLVALGGHRQDVFSVSLDSGQARLFQGSHVTPGFFDVFGVSAVAGRLFTAAADANAGGHRVVLRRQAALQLGSDVNEVIGRTVKVNSVSHEIIGVVADRFRVPENAELWILSATDVPPSPVPGENADRDMRYFQAAARVRADLSEAAVQADLARVAALLNGRRRPESESRRLVALPMQEELVGPVRPAIMMLQAGVGLVLLIACVNISSLLIARTSGRERELAVRAALGARGTRLMRQLLTESLILGGAGGALGLLLGQWGVTGLLRVLPRNVPRTDTIAIDGTVAVVTILTAMIASVVFGALPALHASRANASAVLRSSGSRTATSRSGSRSVLVVAEIALTMVLLVSAGLLAGSLAQIEAVDPGFTAEGAVVAPIAIPQSRYPTADAQSAGYARLLEALSARPELGASAIGFPGPLQGDNASGTFVIPGRVITKEADRPFAHLNAVSPRYFDAMGIPIRAGRAFTDADLTGPPTVIISETMARRHWPDGDALGRSLSFEDDGSEAFRIVGISGDVRQLGLRKDAPPLVFFPYTRFPLPFTNIVVRTDVSESVVRAAIGDVLKAVDSELPLPTQMRSLPDIVSRSVADARFRSLMFSVLGLVALALATVGVYGLVSYSVAQQTREIGIRVALGAAPRQIVTTVVKEGAVLGVLGVAFGLGGAWFATRALEGFLFGVGSADLTTFAAAGGLLVAVALLASYLPARRAMRVEPTVALRAD